MSSPRISFRCFSFWISRRQISHFTHSLLLFSWQFERKQLIGSTNFETHHFIRQHSGCLFSADLQGHEDEGWSARLCSSLFWSKSLNFHLRTLYSRVRWAYFDPRGTVAYGLILTRLLSRKGKRSKKVQEWLCSIYFFVLSECTCGTNLYSSHPLLSSTSNGREGREGAGNAIGLFFGLKMPTTQTEVFVINVVFPEDAAFSKSY